MLSFLLEHALRGVLIAALLVAFPACSPTTQHADYHVQEGVLAPNAQAAGDVSLQLGNVETFREMMEGNRGKVVLVDFWATWCGPCVQQFPHTVAMSNRHRERGLAVIAVSMNEPDEKESVRGFLAKQGVPFEALLTEYGAGAAFVDAFELRGDLPFYKLYDRNGELRYQFSGNPEGVENCEPIEKVEERIEELLAQNDE